MSEARALLEALVDHWDVMAGPRGHHLGCDCGGSDDGIHTCRSFEAAFEAARELIRRADRPEARVAVEGLTDRVALLVHDVSDPGELGDEHCVCRESVEEVVGRHPWLANLPAPRPPEPDRTAALVEGMDAAIHLVQQSLDTVRGEGDGESRSIKVSIAAREHVIGLLAAYRERLATQPRKPTRPLNEWEEWKRECWAAADVAALAPTPDEAP
jgi:hypothetical protein